MTCLYFAGPQSGQAIEAARLWDWDTKPLSILVSYSYLDAYMPAHPYYAKAKSFMLDSGAFTAYTIGKPVDIDALIAEANKPLWDEAVGLDVIGDHVGSRKNAEYMLTRCPKAMPVFHIGDPWDLLDYYVANWDKVGLSCRFGEAIKTSMRFYDQCFSRSWPHKFHSFGWVDEKALLANPFHSADAATWIMAPAAFRNFPYQRGTRQVHLPIDYNLKLVVDGVLQFADRFWRMEQRITKKWASTLATIPTKVCRAAD